jgi:hypothetical protein
LIHSKSFSYSATSNYYETIEGHVQTYEQAEQTRSELNVPRFRHKHVEHFKRNSTLFGRNTLDHRVSCPVK